MLKLIAAVRMYRARRGRIVLILLLSLVVHVMVTTSVWLCSDESIRELRHYRAKLFAPAWGGTGST